MKIIQKCLLGWACSFITQLFVGVSLAMATNLTFEEGYWRGQLIPNDPEYGCYMYMPLDHNVMMSIYVNDSGHFDLAFQSRGWDIKDVADINAVLEIDGEVVDFTRVFLYDPSFILIRGVTLDDAMRLENLIRKATSLRVAFEIPDYFGETSFFDNHLAVTSLKNCVRAQQLQSNRN